nr:hypothetical protein [Chloroflexia bacterium]
AYLPDEQIDLGIGNQDHELELDQSESIAAMSVAERQNGGVMGEEERALAAPLIRFLDELEHNSPYMSFNFMAERAFESSGLPHSISEIAALLNTAIEDGVFKRDTKTVWNRATNEYRDINIFKLNRSHQLVAQTLAPAQEEPVHQEEPEVVGT